MGRIACATRALYGRESALFAVQLPNVSVDLITHAISPLFVATETFSFMSKGRGDEATTAFGSLDPFSQPVAP